MDDLTTQSSAVLPLMNEISEQIEFSVIVCAYTEARWDALVQALEAVERQTFPAREILLVIDHNQALFERATRQFPRVRVLENRYERGLSGARNTALPEAAGNVLAFVDEDAIPAPDWLAQLAASYDDPIVIGVGGTIEPLWEDRRPGWFPAEFDWTVGCTYLGMPESASPVRNLIGCNMSFRREAFQQVGGFRSNLGRIGVLPEGCEETELCIRLRQDCPGKELIYQPAALVQHRIPLQRANWKYFLSRCYAEGVSKAKVSRLVGSQDGLSTERAYMLRTLPRGVTAGLRDALWKADFHGILRSIAIVAGLSLTAVGFLAGRFLQR